MEKNTQTIPLEKIVYSILIIRGQKVLFDKTLAFLYGVTTKRLNEAIRRNSKRFPNDFMFKLTQSEAHNLRSQFATSSYGGRRYLPYAFTEHGVAMLSSVLRSERAILVNIEIMRTFTRLRQILQSNKELAEKLASLEEKYDDQFKIIFQALKELMEPPPLPPKGPMGFQAS